MGVIPLSHPGQIQAQTQMPRVQPKSVLAANLGAQALSVTTELGNMMHKDRERRDYQEHIVSANTALNSRNFEALSSNDPRTMLDNFNAGVREDFDTIRSKIKNPLLQQDFDFQTAKSVGNARMAVLGHQLKMERQESESQRDAFSQAMLQSASLDGSSDNLLEIRDQFQNATDASVETGDMTREQANAWNMENIAVIEKQIINDAIVNGEHEMILGRIENGEFPSIPADEMVPIRNAIQKHKMDQNFTDWTAVLINGGANRARQKEIIDQGRANDLTESAVRSLIALNQRLTDAKVREGVDLERVEAAWNREPGAGLMPGDAADKKAVTAHAIANRDRRIAEHATDTSSLYEMRADDIDRYEGIIPKHWDRQAWGVIHQSRQDPEAAIAAAGMIFRAYRGNRSLYDDMDASIPGLGTKAFLLDLFARGGMDPKANELLVSGIAGMATPEENQARNLIYTKKLAGNPLLSDQLFSAAIQDEPTRFRELGDKTIQEFSEDVGIRDPDERLLNSMGIAGDIIRLLSSTPGGRPAGFSETGGENLITTEDRGISEIFQNIGQGNKASLFMPEEGKVLYDNLLRAHFVATNNMEAASQLALKSFMNSYQPSNFGGVPRWMFGAPEFDPGLVPTSDGSIKWGEEQIIAIANSQLNDLLRPVRDLSNLLDDTPDFGGLDDTLDYFDRFGDLLGAAQSDDPANVLAGGGISGAVKELGIATLGSLMNAGGDPRDFSTSTFNKWFKLDGPKIRLSTTPELMRHKPEPEERPNWTVQGYNVEVQQNDGTWLSWHELPGFDQIYKVFYFDKDTSPEFAADNHAKLMREATSLARHEMRQGNTEASLKQKLAAAGIKDATVWKGFQITDSLNLTDRLSEGLMRGQRSGRRPKPRFFVDRPDFDRDKFLQDNPP